MSSPVATIADALIAFILSLLRDPNAAEQFIDDPESAMAQHGVQGACLADVRAVKPIIVDDPQVEPKPPSVLGSTVEPNEVVRELVQIMNQFTTVDARSTVVDQSVNQNIWTEGGDLTQVFDQEAVIAAGDQAIAAGNDVNAVDQDLDLTVGDVTVGNDTYNDSFNDADPNGDSDAAPEPSEPAEPETPQTPTPLPEPADELESDLTSASDDTYDSDTAAVPVDDTVIDAPVDE